MNWKDIGMRFLWTVLAAVAGAVGAVNVVDMAVVNAALMAGLMATVTFLSLLARDALGMLDQSSYLQRIGWTFLQAMTTALIAVPAFNVNGIKAAAMAGMIAAFNLLSMVARDKSVISPGK